VSSPSDLCPHACGARRFEHRVAIVTGAAQGIGKATALRLAAEGAAVAVVDIEGAGAEAVAATIREHGEHAEAMTVDVRGADATRALMADAVAHFGRIDALVNNVGGSIRVQPFTDFEARHVHDEIDRSLFTAMWCCQAAIPYLLDSAGGAIVNVGSNAPRGILRVPYAVAKGGVFALTTSLAAELAPRGLRVNCVAPGGTVVRDRLVPRPSETDPELRRWNDEMVRSVIASIPMGRRGEPHEQAAAIAFLASDDASFITGQILSVAGGATVP
jgi:dihydroxycyclohexadiene carboxylate dehydrogenase